MQLKREAPLSTLSAPKEFVEQECTLFLIFNFRFLIRMLILLKPNSFIELSSMLSHGVYANKSATSGEWPSY